MCELRIVLTALTNNGRRALQSFLDSDLSQLSRLDRLAFRSMYERVFLRDDPFTVALVVKKFEFRKASRKALKMIRLGVQSVMVNFGAEPCDYSFGFER